MEKDYRIFCEETDGHNVRYVTFHFFGATSDEIMSALEKVFPNYFYGNGYIDDEEKYACIDVSKAVTCDAQDLSAVLPGVRVYGENGWTEVEGVTMCAYLNGKEYDGYMIAKSEEIEDDPIASFAEYDEYADLFYGICTIIDIPTGKRIEFGCAAIEQDEIEDLSILISKHKYDKTKDKKGNSYGEKKIK